MNKRLWLIFLSSTCLTILGQEIVNQNNFLEGKTLEKVFIEQKLFAQNISPLHYEFLGQKIPIREKEDVTAVLFQSQDRSSGGESYHLRLQEHLNSGNRAAGGKSTIEVTPIGRNYALIELAEDNRELSTLKTQIQQQDYVREVLPVITVNDGSSGRDKDIILPNEIVLSFDAGLSDAEKKTILQENQLELIRPVRFSSNLYLVKSLAVSGVEVLKIANQLNSVTSVESASPNFIETLGENFSTDTYYSRGKEKIALNSRSNSLIPMQWHLDSQPLRSCLNRVKPISIDAITQCSRQKQLNSLATNNRTDVRAIESWQDNSQGAGVLVAVIDTFIQWDHPDLIDNIHQVENVADRLSGESKGWDFVEEDGDTRLESDNTNVIRHFRNAFVLDSATIKLRYPKMFRDIQKQNPELSEADIIRVIRRSLLNEVAGKVFHGTTVAGVIAANPKDNEGVSGVAPKAKILPIKAGSTGFSAVNVIESLGYAEFRGADVINLSLSSELPVLSLRQKIQQLLQTNPNLAIVASSGNQGNGQIGYPAAIPGVISVGATNMAGFRSEYSNYGDHTAFSSKLTLVAPGGDFSVHGELGGILTTGGTAQPLLIDGLNISGRWGDNWDRLGQYRWASGTSFSAPLISGIVALIKGEDPENKLNRQQIIDILQTTATYDSLQLRKQEREMYATSNSTNFNSAEEYFFGAGLVNAEAAIKEAKKRLNE